MDRRQFIQSSGKAGLFFLLNPYSYNSTSVVVENLVVGTGYGGAVTALRLTQAGHEVTMLEMGLDWENNPAAVKPFSNMGTPSNNSTWLSNTTKAPFFNITTFAEQYTGILDRWDFEHVKVYMGLGVGGGSLVNGGMSVTPKRPYFEEVFPHLDSDAFYNEFFPLANTTLQVNVISNELYDNSEYYKFSRVGVAEAQNAGFQTVKVPNVYDFDYMHKEEYENAPPSAMAQEVIYGNNHGKNSLEKTYIQQARATGLLTIHDLHQVDTIKQRVDGRYEVEISILSTDGTIVGYKKMITNRLFMAAGSLGTTKLLLKARKTGTLPNLDATIGEKWGNNGNIMAGRWSVNTIFNPIETGQNDGRGTGEQQATIPVDGIDNWDDTTFPYFVEIAPFPTGIEGYASLYLLINRTPELGKLHYSKDNNYEIIPEWNETHNANMVTNAFNFLDRMIAANGGTYTGVFDNGIGPDICYHPLGGCVIGHATDNYGRVNHHTGLYVMDGALVPGTIGVNPYVTITALAEHNIQTILAEDF